MQVYVKVKQYSSRQRQEIYDICCGDREQPECNICGRPVQHGQEWDVSHDPRGIPAALGGDEVAIAHRKCNRRHGAEVITPMMAKVKRVREHHTGAFETRHKLPGGRWSKQKKKMNGQVVPRKSFQPEEAE